MPPEEEIETTGAEPAKMVPYERLRQTITQRDAAAAEVEALRARVAELEPVAEQLSGLQSKVGALSVDLQLAERGLVDPEGRDIARLLHSRLPEADRPSLADWIQTAGNHPALSAYLRAAQQPPASPPAEPTPPAAETPASAPPPSANTGTRPPGTQTPVTAAQLDAARDEVRRDPSQANRDALRALISRFAAGQ